MRRMFLVLFALLIATVSLAGRQIVEQHTSSALPRVPNEAVAAASTTKGSPAAAHVRKSNRGGDSSAYADLAVRYQDESARLINAALADSTAYDRLAYMADTFGPRFSGTDNLEAAIDWILATMQGDGLQNVHGEQVMVPKWVRGRESLSMIEPRRATMQLLGLGGSVGTGSAGVEADALVVSSFDELVLRSDAARGRIVVFNVPFTEYGVTVRYRVEGASKAAEVGAVASLVRSVGPVSLYTPHTGMMTYKEGVPKIPHAAITIEDANMMQRMQDRGQSVRLRLRMDARTEGMAPSRNIVAEIVGSEYPDEVVIMGGHIDSWDVGQGAVDDGGGSVAAWQALLLMKRLGLRPRRTVRVVLWTNEENGLGGARAYRDAHESEIDGMVLAIESDSGVFAPLGFSFTGSQEARNVVTEISSLLEPVGAGMISGDGGGADIGPLMERGVPGMGLVVDGTRYFWYHHTNADTIDKIDPRELNLCAASLAVMAYVVADMANRLPRELATY